MLHRGPARSSARAIVPGSSQAELELFGIGDAFLPGLPEGTRAAILAGATGYDIAAGEPVLDGGPARVGILETGLAREYLTAGDGRQVTVRYIHPGVLIGNLSGLRGDRSPCRVQAVAPSRITELNAALVFRLMRTDSAVAVAMFAEASRWLEDAYVALAATAFGSMRERVARHLLHRAQPEALTGRLVAPVTQQQLAEAIGTAREVVARIFRDLRAEGLIRTGDGIEILDPARMEGLVGRWRSTARPPDSRPSG